MDNQKKKFELHLSIKPTIKTAAVMKLTRVIDMDEENFSRQLSGIIHTKEFQELVRQKVIIYKPLKKLSPTNTLEFNENINFYKPDTSEIFRIIAENSKVVELVRNIGEENYKKYFLSYDLYSLQEIAKDLKITVDEVKQISEFTDKIMIYNEVYPLSTTAVNIIPPTKKYIKIARISVYNGQLQVTYLTPSMIRGEYIVDYKKFNEMLVKVPLEERKKIIKLIEQLKLINLRKRMLHEILEIIISTQKKFLLSKKLENLNVLTQKDLAEKIGVHPSLICRLIGDKTVILPWGEEKKLKSLLTNKKQVIVYKIQSIIQRLKKKYIQDKELCKILEKEGWKIPRRTVNYYKNIVLKENI